MGMGVPLQHSLTTVRGTSESWCNWLPDGGKSILFHGTRCFDSTASSGRNVLNFSLLVRLLLISFREQHQKPWNFAQHKESGLTALANCQSDHYLGEKNPVIVSCFVFPSTFERSTAATLMKNERQSFFCCFLFITCTFNNPVVVEEPTLDKFPSSR